MAKNNPKVFICHASEDKERFVIDFAKRLRTKGVDAWIDKWEINLGDNLVDNIFEEGIKYCDICMIILSKYSVNKRWVKEELSSMVVKRIEDNIRLIPVIIDKDLDIPQSIRHLLRKPIDDPSNYEKEFEEILMSIYGVNEKPPLGVGPSYVREIANVPGFTKLDGLVFRIVGEIIYEKDNFVRVMDISEVIGRVEKFEIAKDQVINSLEVLESRGYWELIRCISGIEDSRMAVSFTGFLHFCEIFLENFKRIHVDIVACLINEKPKSAAQIVSSSGYKLVVVESLLEYFESLGYILVSHEVGRQGCMIRQITATGKRYFESLLL